MDFVRQSLQNIYNTARQKFGDNEGFFQQGKFSAQPIRQMANNVVNTPVTDIVPSYRNLRMTTQQYNPQAWQSIPTLKSMYQQPTTIPMIGSSIGRAQPIIDYLNPSGYGQNDYNKFKGAVKAAPRTAFDIFATSKVRPAMVATSGLMGGAFNKATGGDFAEGVKSGIDFAPTMAGVGAFTNPIISGVANKIGNQVANPLLKQAVTRGTAGLLNVPESFLYRKAMGVNNPLQGYGAKDLAIDVAGGAVFGGPHKYGEEMSGTVKPGQQAFKSGLEGAGYGAMTGEDPRASAAQFAMFGAGGELAGGILGKPGKMAAEGAANVKNIARVKVKPEFTYTPATNLKPQEKIVEKNMGDYLTKNYQKAKSEYQSMFGKEINTDNVRELSPEYRNNRNALSAAVHEPSSAFTKKMYEDALKVQDPAGNNRVLFTAGGTGAGKSSAIKDVPSMLKAQDEAQIIYDTNLNGFESSKKKIQQALDAGKTVGITYVHRDPVDSLVNGAVPRAIRMGRTVPMDSHIDTHTGVQESIPKLMEYFKNDPRVGFTGIDNTNGKGGAIEAPLENLIGKVYNKDELRKKLHEALNQKYQQGEVPSEVYTGFTGQAPPAALDPQSSGPIGTQPQPQQPDVGSPYIPPEVASQQLNPLRQQVARIDQILKEKNPINALKKMGVQPKPDVQSMGTPDTYEEMVRQDPRLMQQMLGGETPYSTTTTKPPEVPLQVESIIQEGRKSIGKPMDKSGKGVKQIANEIYTQWVDRFHPISQVSNQAKKQLKAKGAVLRPEYDPEVLVRRLTGAGGIADSQYRRELKPIIDKLEQFGISKDDMDVYLAHKRMAGFGDVGREVYGSDPVKSQNIINAIETKYGESIKSVADELYSYQDRALKELSDSGFLSPQALHAIKSQNPNYSPLYRVMDEMDNYLGVPTRKTMQGTSPIEKIKGSNRQIVSPVESIIANTFRNRAAMEKNRVARSIVKLQEVAPDLGFKRVDKSAGDTITVWNQGNKEYWQVGEGIASTAKGLNEENMNTLLKIFTAPAALLRQGATGRNPEFMIPNIIRDQLDASITSRYGYIPFVDYVSGLKSMLTKDDIYRRWESSGAKIDLGEMSGRKTIQASFDTVKKKKRLTDWLGKTLDTMGKYSEQPTRVGLFKKAYQKTGNEMMSMMESRDATVDFARMGSKMKVANSIIPFLNVGVQGFDKLIRATRNNPAKVAALGTLYGVLPSVSATLYNIMYHPQEYAEVPQYDKDANFVFIKGRNENGTVDYFTIPKGNVIPLIANPAEHFLSYMAGQDSESFAEFATKFISSALPVVGDGATPKEVAIKTIGSNLPQLVKPATEALLNKSFYKYDPKKAEAKEIVPYYLKDEPGYKQDYEFTPKMYKAIGAVLNVSPLQIKNAMEGYLAGYAKIPAQVIQVMSDVSEGKESSPNDVTLLRRFMKQTYETGAPKDVTEPKTPSLMERITGKAGATDGRMDILAREKQEKRAKAQYRENLTDVEKQAEDSFQTYYNKVKEYSKLDSSSPFTKEKQSRAAMKLADTINDNDYMNEEMKTSLLKQLPVSKQDLDYYNISKESVELKQLYVTEQLGKMQTQGATQQEIFQWIIANKKKINGNSIVTPTMIDKMVDDGLMTKEEGKYIKAIDIDKQGQVVVNKAKLGKAKKGRKGRKLAAIKIRKVATPKGVKISAKLPKLTRLKGLTSKSVAAKVAKIKPQKLNKITAKVNKPKKLKIA